MSPESLMFYSLVVLTTSLVALTSYKKLPKKVKRHHYTRQWREIQKLCIANTNWPQAILNADQLLDEVLKKRRKLGKTMGERLVAAQHDFSNNDGVWQAHKLANHVRHNTSKKLKENDVKSALVSFRQALRDLGAL
jgi:hypothetical protein